MKSVAASTFILVCLLTSTVSGRAEENKLPDQAKAILDKAPEFEYYSLEPSEKPDKENALHGWKILGKTTVKDAESRKKLLTALTKSIAEGKEGAKCFDPRHAIRARHGGKTVDVLICFECSWVYVYLDGKKEPVEVVMAKGAQPLFDKVLRDAGVPLAKNPKDKDGL